MSSVRYDMWRETGLKRNSQRLMLARQRRERQKRWMIIIIIALILLALFIAFIRRTAPTPPTTFKVTWLGYNAYRELPPGSMLVLRPNQKIRVVPLDATNWNVKWIRGEGMEQGQAFQWSGGNKADVLTARCRGKATGLQVLATPFWPRVDLSLSSIAIESAGGTRRRIAPQGEAWLAPHIIARRAVTWDEKALPLLNISKFSGKVPQLTMNPEDGRNATVPAISISGPPQWEIVPSFDETQSAAPNDGGTYVKLISTEPETELTKAAQEIVREQPAVSLKFIIRLDQKPPTGIMRIAFDGKGERKAWIRRPGEASGGPFEWDTTNPGLMPLPPSQPRRNS